MTLPPIQLRFDMRCPDWGAPREALYAAAIEMAAYGDAHGFTAVSLAEHHGVEDGYCPSSITLAAAIAARTQRIRLNLSAIVVPLHDPLRLAEELAVLDIISKGRTALVAVGGYVPAEFDMFDRDFATRGRAVEECIQALRAAWTGEPFDFRGRTVRVTPRPASPHLPIYMGGAKPVAAKRAGRLADGFITHDPALHRIYVEEARRLGRSWEPMGPTGPAAVFVTEDPEATWDRIGRHALHETESYGKWQNAQQVTGAYSYAATLEAVKATGTYSVVTPDECMAMLRADVSVMFHPLVAGLDPAVGWESLRLFVEKVLPHVAAG
ncbi:LLM class flavin-dependent oxidoreductase [Flavisphingomonas formosensis]|uniref:LLM class flavin-dependent oxidoreductase n=1 Tax=Flavisphingomonas formosensis TaxID=861534 RepID=UPI0012F85503|nr:LLM class flavin-dependent oxidoreductase [Sphingomonas formosensis]